MIFFGFLAFITLEIEGGDSHFAHFEGELYHCKKLFLQNNFHFLNLLVKSFQMTPHTQKSKNIFFFDHKFMVRHFEVTDAISFKLFFLAPLHQDLKVKTKFVEIGWRVLEIEVR